MSLAVMARASSKVLPLAISERAEVEAMAEAQPYVFQRMSVMVSVAWSIFRNIFIWSPQMGVPTRPTVSAGKADSSPMRKLRGFKK